MMKRPSNAQFSTDCGETARKTVRPVENRW